jgi:hypothetical protein
MIAAIASSRKPLALGVAAVDYGENARLVSDFEPVVAGAG